MDLRRLPPVFPLVILACLVGPLGAQQMIDPATITVTPGSEFDATGTFSATNLLDGALDEGNRDAHLGTHWLAANGTFMETLTFDLGAAYTLTQLKVLNTSNSNWNDSETDTFTIATSTDGGVTFSDPGPPVTLQDFDLGFQDVPLVVVDATHVQLVVSNDGIVDGDPPPVSEARVGLNEIQFFQNPGGDSDGDGLLDTWEIENFGDLSRDGSEDEDLPAPDGLTNRREHDLSTDPKDPDSDEDGLTDGDEVLTYLTNPLDEDSDGDTLTDGEEIDTYNTDPNSADSDGDTLSDADEVNLHGTNPNDADTDGDSLSDADEINVFGSDPLTPNSDPRGTMIDPATITALAGSRFDATGTFDEANLLDSTTDEGNRDGHRGNHWLAANGTFTETVTFDLGSSYNLTNLEILNTSNTNWNDSETDTFTVATSSDGGTNFSSPSDEISLQVYQLGFQLVPLQASGVTHVQLVVTNDGVVDGDPPPASEARVGLNEVRFFTGLGRPFAITSITMTGEARELIFTSNPGGTYAIDFSYDLTEWLEVDDGVPSMGDTTTYTDSDPFLGGKSRVYYRVRQVP